MQKFKRAAVALGIAALSVICAAFAYALRRAPAFSSGERYELYYTASSSELMEETNAPFYRKLLSVTAGESVRYSGDRYQQIKEQFRAELLFREETEGIVNYYLYSPLLGDGVLLNGYAVNLHVSVGAEQTAAGTPLIFGGY